MKPHRAVASQNGNTPPSVSVEHRPLTFRLPKPGKVDEHFGLSRATFYVWEKQGLIQLIRIVQPGKQRGITLARYDQVRALIEEKIAGIRPAV